MIVSPYSPGFGKRPSVFVGRDEQLARAGATLTKVQNSGDSTGGLMVLVGSRGLGKTVTLGALADDATARGFLTAATQLDRVSDAAQQVAEQIARSLAHLEGVTRERSAAPATTTREPPSSRRQALVDVLVGGTRLAVAHDHHGLVLLLDEVQEAREEDLVVLVNALQEVGRAGEVPIAVFGAGLVTAPERLMDAASFAERFDYQRLEPLRPDDAERALVQPALNAGVRWEQAAIAHVLELAHGSPYLIQQLGDETWNVAAPERGRSIALAETERAGERVLAALADGMFRGRWSKATPVERQFLAAMAVAADDSGLAHTRHVTALTGRGSTQLSTARRSLIDKGLVESPGHAQLRFSVPGFGAFVLDQLGLDWLGPAVLDGADTVAPLVLVAGR